MWGVPGKARALMALGVLLLLGVAAGSLYALQSIIERKDRALFEWAEGYMEAAGLEEAYERKLSAGRGILLARDPGSREDYEQAAREVKALIDQQRRSAKRPAAHQLLDDVERALVAHDSALRHAIDEVSVEEAARRWAHEARHLAREARKVLNANAEYRSRLFHEARRVSVRADRRATQVLALTVAAALLLSAIGGALLVRSAARSVSADRRRLGEAERGRAFLGAVLDQVPVGVVAADAPSGRIIHVNRHARRLLTGETPEYVPREVPLGRAVAGETVEYEEFAWHDRVFANTAGPVRDPEGQLVAAVVAFTDITERKAGEKERELFLGALGHDLRNPLAAVTLAAQALTRSEDVPENGRRAADKILSASRRMTRLIEQLLDFARSQRGTIPLRRRRCDLVQLARDVVSELEQVAPGTTIRIRDRGGAVGAWDPDRLAQVTQNLLLNAIQHGAKDSPIEVDVGPSAAGCRLEVTNQGEPIPEDIKAHIFEPFRRHGKGGVGLGLYIVHAIVHAHGGTVSVVSAAGTTTFRIELPPEPPPAVGSASA